MKRKRLSRKKISIFDFIIYFVLIILMILFIFPFWQTIVTSLMSSEDAMKVGLKIIPTSFTFESYAFVFRSPTVWTAYGNTIWRTVVGTTISVFTCYFAAYGLSKSTLPFRKAITTFIVFTMFFDGGLIARYLLIKDLNLLNNRWALVLPIAVSAWNIVIARNFLSALPPELEESASIDGANPFVIAFRIIMPLSMPIIAILILWTAVTHWNAWFDAMIYCPKPESVVLQLFLRRMIVEPANEAMIYEAATDSTTQETIKSATIMVAIIPILCVYPFLQKYFVKGVMVGALKG